MEACLVILGLTAGQLTRDRFAKHDGIDRKPNKVEKFHRVFQARGKDSSVTYAQEGIRVLV